MGLYPQDFRVPLDQGGPGQGQPVGGIGGQPSKDQSEHRATVQRAGKAPVLLIHGNGGSADSGQWDMSDLKRMLLEAGYPEESIWAPNYLGTGILDLHTPHTNNVNEVREFIANVCDYLGVDVVDVIAHSLGCSLVYSICRGLERRTTPVNWNRPKQWHRVGTFVALAGAFHGLGPNAVGEWRTGGEFMNELLTENVGGGGETPHGHGKPLTSPPAPHNVTYFCGVARGDFIDAQNPGTGKLIGAINRDYDLGPSTVGHEKIKESRAVFADFLPYLDSVPLAPAVAITVDKDTGSYGNPLMVSVMVSPPNNVVHFVANRVSKVFSNGFIVDKVPETVQGTLANGQALTFSADGMWEVVFGVEGAADDIKRRYWVGVGAIDVTIVTDNSTCFTGSLVVTARVTNPGAALYHSLDGSMWNESANVTIREGAVIQFMAIDPTGIASEVVRKSFRRCVSESFVTANVNVHFIAGRVGVRDYLGYSRQFGFFTPFTLYLVNGDWVLDPDRAREGTPALGVAGDDAERSAARDVAGGRCVIRVRDGDPQPGEHNGAVALTVEAVDEKDEHVTVRYTRDGSMPGDASPAFQDRKGFELGRLGNHTIACYARNSEGYEFYETFYYSITD